MKRRCAATSSRDGRSTQPSVHRCAVVIEAALNGGRDGRAAGRADARSRPCAGRGCSGAERDSRVWSQTHALELGYVSAMRTRLPLLALPRNRLARPDGRHHPALGPGGGVVEKRRSGVQGLRVEQARVQHPVPHLGEEELEVERARGPGRGCSARRSWPGPAPARARRSRPGKRRPMNQSTPLRRPHSSSPVQVPAHASGSVVAAKWKSGSCTSSQPPGFTAAAIFASTAGASSAIW